MEPQSSSPTNATIDPQPLPLPIHNVYLHTHAQLRYVQKFSTHYGDKQFAIVFRGSPPNLSRKSGQISYIIIS